MHRGIYGKSKREVADILKDRGINPTTQRIEIAHFLLQKPQHLSADEVLHQLNSEYEQVSQATVYNTLRLFVQRGVIRELAISPDRVYFDSNTSEHHHFIDVDTGHIYDLPSNTLLTPDIQLDADIEDVTLLVRGRLNGKNPDWAAETATN
ncbi:MAG: transcriptional repressor [Leptospiraceae bacterium]|nr:transcriptional repressor [Leptospiraceae bacterium]MCB1322550.1 transcriptional repressor [Leptospiraceae bacterium]